MNDEMDEKRKLAADGEVLNHKQAREKLHEAMKMALAKYGEARTKSELEMMKKSIDFNNKVMGTSIRASIPVLDAMIFGIAAVPPRAGMDIMQRKEFVEFMELLYAMRHLLAQERDAEIKNKAAI